MNSRKLHFFRLVTRGLLFLAALLVYLIDKTALIDNDYIGVKGGFNLIIVIWVFFAFEMVLRFIPTAHESMGCQKQFERNYVPVKNHPHPTKHVLKQNRRSVAIVLTVWVLFNAIFGVLHLTNVIDNGIMVLLMLFYAVCDIICILFYCPFQSLMMKNRCCVSCRIYNWDYAMMFTPAVFVRSWYTLTLLLMGLALVIRWEIAYYRHPERFSETTNQSLFCKNCTEHLCVHKKAIRTLAVKSKNKIYATAIEKFTKKSKRDTERNP